MVTGIHRRANFISILVCNVQSISIFIAVKQFLMSNCICILYLSILQILKFTAAYTAQ